MRKLITWLLPTIGIVALGLAIYIAKIDHDLSVGLRRDFDRRFSDSGGRFLVISGGPAHAALTNDEKESIMRQRSGQIYLVGKSCT